MEKHLSLLERYRRDRRQLIEFVLSSGYGLIKELRSPSGSISDVDFDTLSAEYIIHCIKSGGVVDISEATKKYFDESAYPISIHSQFGDSYFLVSDPDSAGSTPRRVPPPIYVKQTTSHASCSSSVQYPVNVENFATTNNDYKYKAMPPTPMRPARDDSIPPLGLPSLKTGFLKDCRMIIYGKQPTIIACIRFILWISEALDACIRRNLIQLTARKMCGQVDLPQISLDLLIGTFKSDFVNEKAYTQWKTRQANILEELCFSAHGTTTEHLTVRSCLEMIRDTTEWDFKMSASGRVEILLSIRQVALKLQSMPGRFGIQNESYFWTAAYHLNIRLYEKLLFAMFDVLDESQLIEEADAIMPLIKLTWSTLGITQKMHYAIFAWVLFQQFVGTGEGMLLEYAEHELQKVSLAEEDDGKEVQYMNSLMCSRKHNDRENKLTLVQAIFVSIRIWCDSKLQDYHLHFCKDPSNFKRVMALASAVGVFTSGDCAEIKITKLNTSDDNAARNLKRYVKKSTEAACWQAASTIDLESKVQGTFPLALLANELRSIAEREQIVFGPVICRWCSEALMISAVLLHQFYGERLKPFLLEVTSLSEEVRSVLLAANKLDHYLTQLYASAFEKNGPQHCMNQLEHYQIGEVCRSIILDWVIAQHARILEWTGRAFDLEDWDPLSFQQRQAASIIEVFRIIEETVDQFFGLNLPLDITHLQALLSIIFHSLDAYLQRLLNQLALKRIMLPLALGSHGAELVESLLCLFQNIVSVEQNHLYPSAPPLTRYEETVFPMVKKKLLEFTVLDESVGMKLNDLTIPRLCIMLNTLQYIQKQVTVLEDGIRKSWALAKPSVDQASAKEELQEALQRDYLTTSEAVDELFTTTLNIIRDTAVGAISKIGDFVGARVVFWDLRDSFLSCLYHGSVETARLESFLPRIDTVLDHICGLIDDSLRDFVVLSICRASLKGYVWVLLDGGPSRSFSYSDIRMMEDDLNMLKEFFIADGDGLPRSLVEQEAKFAEEILSLFTLQSETLIRMLLSASECISVELDPQKHGHMHLEGANTLVRVLCHKKDREASKFLKRQYRLPTSSEYDDTPSSHSTFRSPIAFDVLKRSNSFHWTKNGQSSFKTMKKKLQKATSEIKNVSWS